MCEWRSVKLVFRQFHSQSLCPIPRYTWGACRRHRIIACCLVLCELRQQQQLLCFAGIVDDLRCEAITGSRVVEHNNNLSNGSEEGRGWLCPGYSCNVEDNGNCFGRTV